MRLRGNEIAACVLIALGVGGVLTGAFISERQLGPWAPAPTPTPVATPAPTPSPTPEPTPLVQTVRFSATGDNLIHDGIYLQARERGEDGAYDFTEAYAPMREFYQQFDVNWLNQETLVNDAFAPSAYPMFSTPGDITDTLYDLGFRVFSVSNNHSYDKGAEGIAATLRFWDSMPEDTVTTGLWRSEEDPVPLQEVNGVTIAYLSYTEHTNGIPHSSAMEAGVVYTHQTDVIERQVRQAAGQADFVVVGMHWGVEDSHTVTDAQRALAQKLADWGADVIVGTHPHVLQNAGWLTAEDGRRVFAAYSLGNFLSTQSKKDQLIGAVLTLRLQKTTSPDGTVQLEVLDPQLHPTVTHYGAGKSDVRTYLYRDYTPELAAAHGVRANDSDFSYDYIRAVAQQYIDPAFLDLS